MANRRCDAEWVEKSVVASLLEKINKPIPDVLRESQYGEVDTVPHQQIVNHLYALHPRMTGVEWIGGGDYSRRGDVLIHDPNPIAYELKVVKSGSGTLANVSERFFQLIDPTLLSWMEWEEETGVRQARWAILENHIDRSFTSRADFVNTARALRNSHDPIMGELAERANAGKVQYLTYILPTLKREVNRLAGIMTGLTQGHHTQEAIRDFMVGVPPEGEYRILVHNTTDQTITVSSPHERVVILDIVLAGQKVDVLTNMGLFSIVAHYKNVAQGVDTPCFLFFWRR